MAEIKLTKNELREQQKKLEQLQKYLPVLQLKKVMLQEEVSRARLEIVAIDEKVSASLSEVRIFSKLLTDTSAIDLSESAYIDEIKRKIENIAGVEVPSLENVEFKSFEYDLFETPAWVDGAILKMRSAAILKVTSLIAQEKKAALEKELREVSIRVNLFEKVLVPQALSNIKKIKVFLGDQDLAAVARAKVAKAKIEMRKRRGVLSECESM